MNFSTICISAALLISLFIPAARAEDGKLLCKIEERTKAQLLSYSIELPSHNNHTVYYYSDARLLPHYYIRASGMVGGGARFLHLNLEDTLSGVNAFTRVPEGGELRLGTRTEWIHLQCTTEPDRQR